MRHAYVLCLVAAVFLLPSVPEVMGQGGAGGTAGSGGNTLSAADFFVRLLRPTGKKENPYTIFTDFEQRTYFNRARCQCNETLLLELDLSTAAAPKRRMLATSQARVQVIIGEVGCVAAETQVRLGSRCSEPLADLRLSQLANQRERITIPIPIARLYGPNPGGGQCERQGRQFIRLRVDTNNDDIPDLTGDSAPVIAIDFDGDAPLPPTTVAVTPGNEALEVAWDVDQPAPDFRGFVVFCSRAEDIPVYVPSFYEEKFFTTQQSVCSNMPIAPPLDAGAPAEPTAAASSAMDNAANAVGGAAATVDAGAAEFAAPLHFERLDKDFACSRLLVTQKTTRLQGLQNGQPYLVGVAVVDKHGNPSPIRNVYLQTPIVTRDFYNGYRDAGGEATGGYCALGGGRFSLGVIGLLGVALGGLGLRRLVRRRRQQ